MASMVAALMRGGAVIAPCQASVVMPFVVNAMLLAMPLSHQSAVLEKTFMVNYHNVLGLFMFQPSGHQLDALFLEQCPYKYNTKIEM